ALLALAGAAHLTGSSPFVSLALIGIALLALAMQARDMRRERQLAARLEDDAQASREERERLGDRRWDADERAEPCHRLVGARGDVVVHRDRAGRIVYVNRVFADLLGAAPDELVGKSLSELGMDIGLVPDSAFSGGECLSSTDVAVRG